MSQGELVQMCLKGDDDAWAKLVEEYRGLVYSICYLFCGSTQDAEDLVQDAFLKIWMNLGSYDPSRGELKGWIATVTRNQRVDRYRRTGQDRLTESIDTISDKRQDDGALPMAQRIPDTRPTPHDMAVTSEITGIVTNAVRKISPEMRDVVTMRFVHGFDNQEIAHRLRIPEGTVKSRTNRGRAQLAALLSPMRPALGAA
ncbi:RNA polymerase sigma factor [Acidicapsa dinghuensis]|uniref:RNA polymerase sigma factor n=1 Tax=Acidicapsa dinghuensis TaxID=2218256 RepID=A0ABW1EHI4_9BACT|nr:sigma-70 family RNA polymerase sigma factor [Acidicapsa dinghuensis]